MSEKPLSLSSSLHYHLGFMIGQSKINVSIPAITRHTQKIPQNIRLLNKDCGLPPFTSKRKSSFPERIISANIDPVINDIISNLIVFIVYQNMPENPQACLGDEWHPIRAGVFRGRRVP
jgi:hypothetical protein